MKNRILALALCLALMLPLGSVHAAGSAQDPLISSSYIDGTFVPGMMSAVKAMLAEAMKAHFASSANEGSGMLTRQLSSGSSLQMKTGQTVILLSGSARISIGSGSIVNVTVGGEASDGALNPNHRYIVCEDSAVTINVTSDSTLFVSSSATLNGSQPEQPPVAPVSPFTDVIVGEWWYDDITKAYERGLVNGMTATTYEPQGQLSIAQAVKLAACMHELYYTGSVSLTNNSGAVWYQNYIDYCLAMGIMSQSYTNYDVPATRRQFIELFYAALPQSEYPAINSIPDGAISDITESSAWVDKVYEFYRAGILTGYSANGIYNVHDFGAESNITRAEVATIMNRMFDYTARQLFSME